MVNGRDSDHAMAAWMGSLALKISQPPKTTTPEPALGERLVTIKLSAWRSPLQRRFSSACFSVASRYELGQPRGLAM